MFMDAAVAVRAAEPSLAKTKVSFDDKGLSSIQVESKERLLSGKPWVWRVNLGGDRIILDNVSAARPIAPGTQDKFAVEVRLGGPGSAPLKLAQEFIAKYRATHPSLLNWRDRRPILRLFFNGGLSPEEA